MTSRTPRPPEADPDPDPDCFPNTPDASFTSVPSPATALGAEARPGALQVPATLYPARAPRLTPRAEEP